MLPNLFLYIGFELFVWFIILLVVIFFFVRLLIKIQLHKKLRTSDKFIIGGIIFFLGFSFYLFNPNGSLLEMPMYTHSHAPGGKTASVPVFSAIKFLLTSTGFEKIKDIGADPNAVPVSQSANGNTVRIDVTAYEVVSEVSEGAYFNYWTFNKQVPGPMYRVRVGDTIIVSLTNDKKSLHHHSIDFHSVTGPGGGAAVTHVAPGETKSFKWKALNPGLYVYHCAMPNVSTHNSHGQYGMILVEPKEGLPSVDKEFYVMQGELYTMGGQGKKGLTIFDSNSLLKGDPTYITFNGKVETTPRMKANVGDKIRMYVGNGGVNLISSFHVIGEIFDTVYPEGAIGSDVHKNIQTTAVLPGGATIVEFTVEVPGKYVLVDHALARLNKGAWAILEVTGPENHEVFEAFADGMHINEH